MESLTRAGEASGQALYLGLVVAAILASAIPGMLQGQAPAIGAKSDEFATAKAIESSSPLATCRDEPSFKRLFKLDSTENPDT